MNPTYEQASPAASKVIINLMQEIERLKQENKELHTMLVKVSDAATDLTDIDHLQAAYDVDITLLTKLLEGDTDANNT